MAIRKITTLCFLFFFGITLAGCGRKEPPITPSGRVIKIGVIGPMSGPENMLGKETLKGIETALHMSPYLKNGDKIKLVTEDDQNKPAMTVKAFRMLVREKKVTAILLLSTSASCLAVNAVADTHKTPVLVVHGTHPDIAGKTRFVSQLCFDNIFQGKVAALFVHDELLIDRVAVFTDPDSFYSSSLIDAFSKQFMKIGGSITDVISIKGSEDTLQDILTNIRNHKAELLYLPVDVKYIIPILNTIREMGWYPECMAGEEVLARDLSQYQEDIHVFDGLLAVDFYSSTVPLTPYGKKAVKEFRNLYGRKGNTFSALGVEGMDLIRAAMNRCQNPEDRICVNDNIRNTVNFEGIMGKITINSSGKAIRPLIVNRVKNGKITGVVKVY